VSFAHNSDLIQLDDAIFRKIGSSLSSGEFYAKAGATRAHDADDRIIYNKSTGALYYDANGNKSGGAGPIKFAVITNKPANLDHGDFDIV
jgi:Ca2+-binding RTX toxin-like protein